MAGRGMGRGGGANYGKSIPGLSLNYELAHGQGEIIQPPPVYPPLLYRPLTLECTDTDEYLLALKRDYLDYLKESPAFFQPVVVKNDIERYSDRYQTIVQSQKRLSDAPFEWSRFPQELRPQAKKRKNKSVVVTKKKTLKKMKISDIKNRLEELEKREEEQKEDMDDDEMEENKGDDEGEEKERDEFDLEFQEEDLDDEMDLGTDYVNNYFDNGETYLDEEDDNLDDGPVY